MCCTFGRVAPLFCSSFPSWGSITTEIRICECVSTSMFHGPGSAAYARQRAEAPCCAAAAVSLFLVCTDYLLPPPHNLSATKSCRPRNTSDGDTCPLMWHRKQVITVWWGNPFSRVSQNLVWWRWRRLCLHCCNCHVSIRGATPVDTSKACDNACQISALPWFISPEMRDCLAIKVYYSNNRILALNRHGKRGCCKITVLLGC